MHSSTREPADLLGDKSNIIGGWLPSLTFRVSLTPWSEIVERTFVADRDWASIRWQALPDYNVKTQIRIVFSPAGEKNSLLYD
jgi:hypothetical protein